MASESERAKALRAVAAEEKRQWADWVKIQEDAGYAVVGDSFANARVVELDKGPVYDERPGT